MSREQDLYFGYKKMQEIAYQNNNRAYSFKEGKYVPNLTLSRTVVDVIIDVTWLEKFERYLPYVENCVNEFRSFLKNEDEIMLIQLSNKIDVPKTLTYMTQHVDSIIEYDEIEDNITPGKLVNTVYENTFDIYENRFLYTLLMRCSDFLGDLYRDVEKIAKKNFVNISFDYNSENPTSETNNDMRIALVFDKSEKQMNNKKVQLDKVSRLFQINEKINELMGSDLIRSLKKCKEVTDPLTMTNVLQKNHNFVKAVSLWNFLAAYDGKKLDIIERERNVPLTPAAKENFYELSSIINLLCRSYVDSEFCRTMDKNYRKYLYEEEKKRKSELEARIKTIKEDITRSLTQRNQKKIDALEEKLYLSGQKIEHYRFAMSASKVAIVENFMAELDKIYLQRRELEQKLVARYSEDLKEEREYLQNMYREHMEEIDLRIKQEKEKNDLQLKQARDEYRHSLKELNKKHQEDIVKLNFIHDAQMQELDARYNEKISKLIDDKNKEIEKQKAAYEEKISNLVEEHAKEIEVLKALHAAEIEELNQTHENEIAELKETHKSEIEHLVAFYDERINQINEENKRYVMQLNSAHEARVESLRRDHERKCEQLERKHQKELELEIDSCERKISALTEEFSIEKSKMEEAFLSEIEKLKLLHKDEIDDIHADNLKNTEDLKLAHKHEIQVINQDFEKQLRDVIEQNSAKIMDYKQTVKENQSQFDRERNLTNAKHKAELREINQNNTRLRAELEIEIKKLRAELNSEKKKHKKEINRAVRDMTASHKKEMDAVLAKLKEAQKNG